MRPCLKSMKGRIREKNVEEEGAINIRYRSLLYIVITNSDTLYIDTAVLLWCYTLIHSLADTKFPYSPKSFTDFKLPLLI